MMLRFVLRHAVLRRLTGLSLLGLCALASLVLLPLAFLVDKTAGLRPGSRGRAARFAGFTGAYLAAEIMGLTRLVWLRIPLPRDRRNADPDRLEHEYYLLLRRVLGRLYTAARRCFGLRVVPPTQGSDLPPGPLIIASRHAGPGDSFLLVYALLETARRRPRIVLSRALTLDPLIDAVLGSTPNCFIGLERDERERATQEIAELARTLGPRDALVIFPEGRNFTALRRARLIERLRRRRHSDLLPTARALEHLLPPRGPGLFAALDAAPAGTHLVFVAHTGLDRIESVRDAWGAVPLGRPVEAAWWSLPADEVPSGEVERGEWLQRQWLRIDAWIDEHGANSQAGRGAAAPEGNQERATPLPRE